MTKTTCETLAERIGFLHTMGLDARYDDVLALGDVFADGTPSEVANADHAAFLNAGPAYDYQAQAWMDHADHAHMCTALADSHLPLLFCGSDITTCVGIAR